MTEPDEPDTEPHPARSRRFQYGIAAVLVVQVVAAVAMGIWRRFGGFALLGAGVIGAIMALSIVGTLSRILRVERRAEEGQDAERPPPDFVSNLMAVSTVLIGVGLLCMVIFALKKP